MMGSEKTNGNSSEVEEDWRQILSRLDREEIEEVLSKDGFCRHCQQLMQRRIHRFASRKLVNEISTSDATGSEASDNQISVGSITLETPHSSPESSSKSTPWSSVTPESVSSGKWKGNVSTMDSVTSKHPPTNHSGYNVLLNDGLSDAPSVGNKELSEDQKENIRFSQVGRRKAFVHMERVNGRQTNVLQGLELYTKVFNAEEQKKIVGSVFDLQRMGQKGQLRGRTYSEPSKWMRGKGRITIQFGCCYNYAADREGNPPGILREEDVDPLPPLFKKMIKRMVRWHILPLTCVPNSCIVNIYDEGDCIPPHIDHHDFLRPFCTVSFLAECNILFGSNLKVVGPGEFSGPVSIPLPVGSVFILNGNGADVAKHCVPAVPARRVSITFRRMAEDKIPYRFLSDPELEGLKPLSYRPSSVKAPSSTPQNQHETVKNSPPRVTEETKGSTIIGNEVEFPPLGSSNSGGKRGLKKQGLLKGTH